MSGSSIVRVELPTNSIRSPRIGHPRLVLTRETSESSEDLRFSVYSLSFSLADECATRFSYTTLRLPRSFLRPSNHHYIAHPRAMRAAEAKNNKALTTSRIERTHRREREQLAHRVRHARARVTPVGLFGETRPRPPTKPNKSWD